MKAQFLKIAGVKTDKEFYDKYPTEEEFFAKCGAKIKKAFPGMKIPKAQQGNIFQNNTFQQPNMGPSSSTDPGFMSQVNTTLQSLTGGNPIQKVFDTIQGFKAQKDRVAGAKQNMQVMGHLEDAKASNDLYEEQNLQDARMKTYVGGDRDQFGMTGEELFPMYGVGTNVLAKNGKKIKAQDGFMSGIGGQLMGSGLNTGMQQLNIGGNDMGSEIGGNIGGTAGMLLGGPAGQAIGKVLGTAAGDLLDKSDSKIERYNQQAENSINNMIGMNMGKSIRSRFGGNLKNGGKIANYAQGGDIQTYGEGGVKPLSYNPYGGEMGMIHGPSHEKGGVDMSVFGQPLEAEGGEPIMKLEDGGGISEEENMVIMGNLEVPKSLKKSAETFTGEKLSGNKFKTMTKSIGKAENKATKIVDRNISKVDEYTPLNKLDRISLNTLDTNINIADNKLKKLQVIKEGMAEAQQALNVDNGTAKNGKKVYAKKGVTTTTDSTTLPPNTFRTEQEALDAGFYKTQDGKLERILEEGQDPESFTLPGNTGAQGSPAEYSYKPKSTGRSWKEAYKIAGQKNWLKPNETFEQYVERAKAEKAGNPEKYTEKTLVKPEVKGTAPAEDQLVEILGLPTTYEYANLLPKEKEKEKEDLDLGWLNNLNLRGSDAEDFNNAQLLPEAWAMANNQLEPVQAQQFNPRLRVPYDISMQDQLNQNTAKARGAERMAAYSPGMLSNLKAQEYMADQNVLGNQFRQNQQFKDQVYSGNLATLNDTQLKNLAIADTQYTRQEQAKSNTKATDFEAIKSMTDKRLKHNLENQTLRVWENMYDYRYNPAGRAQYRGESANFDDWRAGGQPDATDSDQYIYERGPDGKTYRRRRDGQSAKGGNISPLTRIENSELISGGGIAGGQTYSMNGSMVKKFKKFK